MRLLVDAGIRVSPKARDGLSGELLPDLSPLSGLPLDAVLITHAHADHIGAVPLVLGAKPDTPAYATPATIALTEVMLADALRLMDNRREAEGELPSYDEKQLAALTQALRPVGFHQPFILSGKVRVQYFQAGHIPGAASVFLESGEGSILISGDLSFSPMRATPQAEVPPVNPHVLILETTYGGKLHANRRAEEMRLTASVKRVVENGGRVLIPAFALGRAQEAALILDAAVANGELPEIPIYLDGMTRSISQVFARFPEYLSPQLQKHLQQPDNTNGLWRSQAVKFVASMAERDTIARTPEPCVIIASSGMLTGGASPVYAKQLVKEPTSAIFITGYQDEESPGKRLQILAENKGGYLVLEGQKLAVECEVGTYSLSAHADENELTHYAAQLDPQWTWLVHGDQAARQRIAALLKERSLRVRLPELGQVVEPDIRGGQFWVKKKGVGIGQALNGDSLWEALRQHDMTGDSLDMETLLVFWYGDETTDPAEMQAVLESHAWYFAPSQAGRYKIFTPGHVAQRRQRFAWMAELGSLTHRRLLMLRQNDKKLFLGIARQVQDDRLIICTSQNFNANVPLETVVHVGEVFLDEFPLDAEAQAALQQVLVQQEAELAESSAEALSIEQLLTLADGNTRSLSEIVTQLGLDLPDADSQFRLLWRFITFGGNARYGHYQVSSPKPDEFSYIEARDRVLKLLPDTLRKVSADQEKHVLSLRFDFPLVARQRYARHLEQAAFLTGWTIEVNPTTHQGALDLLVRQLVPDVMQVSLRMDQRVVEIKVERLPENWAALQAQFLEETGFQLQNKAQPGVGTAPATEAQTIQGQPIEINAAYGILRQALEPYSLYKTSLKQGGIVLSFITPEVGMRHQALIEALAQETGYPLSIHPHPNQQQIMQVVLGLCQARGLKLKKNPSLQIAEKQITIEPMSPLNDADRTALQQQIMQETAYSLVIK